MKVPECRQVAQCHFDSLGLYQEAFHSNENSMRRLRPFVLMANGFMPPANCDSTSNLCAGDSMPTIAQLVGGGRDTCGSDRRVVRCERPEDWRLQAALTTQPRYRRSDMAECHSTLGASLPATTGVEYRKITGFSGYRVGDDGSVWSCRPYGFACRQIWRKLKPGRSNTGCLVVVLSDRKSV